VSVVFITFLHLQRSYIVVPVVVSQSLYAVPPIAASNTRNKYKAGLFSFGFFVFVVIREEARVRGIRRRGVYQSWCNREPG
jgi:hypothetical protein